LSVTRNHGGIENMQRSKDLILGDDGDPNGSDTAPRNDFSLTSFARQTLKPVSASPTRAIAHLANKTALSAGSPVFPEPPWDKYSQLTPRA
jgi:hypothetical protein